MENIGIIGGGVVGLCSAYYLNRAGYRVTVLDAGDFSGGCSFGNAGMIVPSHFIPLAAPGMISKGIRWMFNSSSPFYIRPRWSGDLVRWGYHFYRSSTEKHVERSVPVLKEISLWSKDLYRQLSKEPFFDFGFAERGLLMLYQTREVEREEQGTVRLAHRHGMRAEVLTPQQVQALEPDVEVSVRGGIYFPEDAHLIPQELVRCLLTHLKAAGVTFEANAEVRDFVVVGGKVTATETVRGDFHFDQVVIAGGAWSGGIAKKVGLSLPLQAGKGYSFTQEGVEKNIRVPSIFVESRVAVTPMGPALRFGGTMEIAGLDHSINLRRVKGIVDSIRDYYPAMNVGLPSPTEVWHGLRPCSPDGLPYLGRLSYLQNVVVATGHAMMGVSLGAATGKIVADLVRYEKTEPALKMFSPERFDQRVRH
jgi:D-amino-acid dehydrogenase